ncbi:acyltransferase domain-containing protein [Streptomyces johnsoniae]|uniref:[acyl-carrier-protein] S-malonyltransferase n=1 Tax=Streptomyces johnsoniae TaxID=3075532 RepID=A0ABU2S4N3_9ACTN|nr:acyltransferase domain-containing protein [Streptomyces sp. DSM 41886]MDT0443030.1 acyltransferase domain-containing protein [Streptomyces sp. DSM 41886]
MNSSRSSGAKCAVLFPGQGGFDGAALRSAAARHPRVGAVFARLDDVTEELFSHRISDLVLGTRETELRDLLESAPWASQIAIYGAGLAAYEILREHGVRPDVLAGHSLGEITALVAAGGFSPEDGARIVASRVTVIERQGGVAGRMVALTTGADRTRRLLDLLDDPGLAIATENHDEQTVVSGPAEALDKVVVIAGQLGVGAAEIDTPFPFHNPALAPVVPEFAAQVAKLTQRPLTLPVYSPILQRHYEPDGSLPDLLAAHFTMPVRFASGVRRLHEDGVGTFVEAGGQPVLSKLVRRVLADPGVRALPTLTLDGQGEVALDRTLDALREAGLASGGPGGSLGELLAPSVPADVFQAYWTERGPALLALVRDEVRAFRERHGAAPAETTPNVRESAAVTEPAAVAEATGPPSMDRERLFAELRALYADTLEYPEEVFEDDVHLEAELGVDSVKQVELLSRVSRQYGLPPRDPALRMSVYDTMGKITDFVWEHLNERHAPQPVPAAD